MVSTIYRLQQKELNSIINVYIDNVYK